MDDLHALQQQQYEGYLQTPEQASSCSNTLSREAARKGMSSKAAPG